MSLELARLLEKKDRQEQERRLLQETGDAELARRLSAQAEDGPVCSAPRRTYGERLASRPINPYELQLDQDAQVALELQEEEQARAAQEAAIKQLQDERVRILEAKVQSLVSS
jgi:hypothetical protein